MTEDTSTYEWEDLSTATVSVKEAAHHYQKVVVFVHGIFSSEATFEPFRDFLKGNLVTKNWGLAYYRYDFHRSLEENGVTFADTLLQRYGTGKSPEVIIIAHSMGGLVARLGALSKKLSFVSKIFLLGTPNLGALSTAQLGILAQLIRRTTQQVFATFLRKPGILELSDAYNIIRKNLAFPEKNTSHIDYISIPGCYFHLQRGRESIPKDIWAGLFQTLDNTFSVVSALSPLLSINMTRPHDGIVEEQSNRLYPPGAGRWSEKARSFKPAAAACRYIHIELEACEQLTHVEIHRSPDVMKLVAEISQSPDVATWYQSICPLRSQTMTIQP